MTIFHIRQSHKINGKKVSLLDMNDSEGNDPNSIPKAFSLKISYEVRIWFSFVLDFQLGRERSYCALRPFPWCHILIRKFQFSLPELSRFRAQEGGGGGRVRGEGWGIHLPSPVTYSPSLKLRLGDSLDLSSALNSWTPRTNDLFTSCCTSSLLRFTTTSGSDEGGGSLKASNPGKKFKILSATWFDWSPFEVGSDKKT